MSIDLDLATTEQIGDELEGRPNEDFIFIFKEKLTGSWVMHFNQAKDWLEIVQTLSDQQCTLLRYIIAHREAQKDQNDFNENDGPQG